MSKFCNVPGHVVYLDGCHQCRPIRYGESVLDDSYLDPANHYVPMDEHDRVRKQRDDLREQVRTMSGVINNAGCMAAQDQIHIVNLEKAIQLAVIELNNWCDNKTLQSVLTKIDRLKKGPL